MSEPDDVSVHWTGPDGSVWDLLTGTGGALVTEGVDGLVLPEFRERAARFASVPGRLFLGVDYEDNPVEFSLHVGDTHASSPNAPFRTGQLWRQLDTAVRRAFSPRDLGRFDVTTSAGTRHLLCRLRAMDRRRAKREHGAAGSAVYDVVLAPDTPLWQGTTAILDFPYAAAAAPVDYYGGSGGGGTGPDFHISAANEMSAADILNPGDEDTWPTWTVTGPCQGVIGVGGALTTLPHLAAGEQLVIDTHPARMSVTDGYGNRAWDRLAGYDFAPIPPAGAKVTAWKNDAAAGSHIRLQYTPQHWAAW